MQKIPLKFPCKVNQLNRITDLKNSTFISVEQNSRFKKCIQEGSNLQGGILKEFFEGCKTKLGFLYF
jgi:hypothetical protein